LIHQNFIIPNHKFLIFRIFSFKLFLTIKQHIGDQLIFSFHFIIYFFPFVNIINIPTFAIFVLMSLVFFYLFPTFFLYENIFQDSSGRIKIKFQSKNQISTKKSNFPQKNQIYTNFS